jgi:hypothetical protein
MNIFRFFFRPNRHEEIMSALTDLQAQVASMSASVDVAVTLIADLNTKLAGVSPDDSAALADLTAALAAAQAKLAAAAATP